MFKHFCVHMFRFALKQANACMFGVFLLALIVLTKWYYPFGSESLAGVYRYDFMLACAVIFQLFLLTLRLESLSEFAVIILFHALAMVMELFKVYAGSWIYPEQARFAIWGVPLFAGFMYSAVGSYIARSHRLFELIYRDYPKQKWTLVLVVLIYVNFFSHHYVWDFRWGLVAFSVCLYWRTQMRLQLASRQYGVPVLAVFFAVAVVIWVAENIATYSNVWLYPNQQNSWQMVSMAKISSWYLLMLLSFVLVMLLHRQGGAHDVSSERDNRSVL